MKRHRGPRTEDVRQKLRDALAMHRDGKTLAEIAEALGSKYRETARIWVLRAARYEEEKIL